MHFVYFLRSERNLRKTYTGYSNSLSRRLNQHNHPDNEGWTRQFQPWRIEAYVQCDTEETAEIVEAYFKNSSGKEKLVNFVRDNPYHPNPKQGFFDTLEVGREFGRGERRFRVSKQKSKTVMTRNAKKLLEI